MRIGEVAARSGLTTATIRFYERSGVLPGPGRQSNGYRHYSAADLDRATTFARLRALDLDPREAGRLADQCAAGHCDATWAELGGLLATHREAIGARIAELQDLDARLAALQGFAHHGWPVGPSHRIGAKGEHHARLHVRRRLLRRPERPLLLTME